MAADQTFRDGARPTRRGALALIGAAALAACAVLPPPAVLSGDDRSAVGQITAYLNGLQSFRADFTQIGPAGASMGEVALARPGRLSVRYTAPRPSLIIANHGRVLAVDLTSRATTSVRLSRTPLDILLAPVIALDGAVRITALRRDAGGLQLSLVKTAAPGQGTLTLRFAAAPLALTGVTIQDQEGRVTALDLRHLVPNVPLDPALFDYHPPPA